MHKTKNEEWKDNQNKTKGILIITLLLVLGIIIGIFAYSWLTVKPKKIFITAIDKMETLFQKQEELQKNNGGTIKFNTNLESNTKNNKQFLNILNNIDIAINYQTDYEAKKMELEFDSNYKNKELLNLKMYVQNNNTYLFLKNIYPKLIQIESEGMEQIFQKSDFKDRQNILNYLQNALKKSLKDNYFQKENVTLKIHNENKKVTKNNLILNEKNTNEIKNAMLEELNQEEFIKSFAKITGNTENEVKEKIKNTFLGIELNDNKTRVSFLKNQELDYDFEWTTATEKISGKIELIEKEKELSLKIVLDSEDLKGNIKLDFITNHSKNMEDIDSNNSINSNNLEQQELEQIFYNLQNTEGIKELVEEFTKFFI